MGNNDWAEVCTYIDGEHAEYELSQTEWAVIDKLLGLTAGRRDPLTRTLFFRLFR